MRKRSYIRIPTCAALVAFGAVACAGGYGRAAGGPAPAPAPRTFTYQPFTASYVVSSHGHVEQQFGGQTSTTESSIRYFLSAVALAGTSGFPVTIRIDSVPELSGALKQLAGGSAAGIVGTTFTGTLLPTGEIHGVAGGDTTQALVQQFLGSLGRFFPQIRAGGVHAGDQWTDTTETTTTQNGIDISIRSISTNDAVAWETWHAVQALHVRTVAQYSISGAGNAGGAAVTVGGTGTTYAQLYLGADGRFVGATAADTSHSTATVAATGASIPVTQMRADTIAVVR
jgi:hypothetical protein